MAYRVYSLGLTLLPKGETDLVSLQLALSHSSAQIPLPDAQNFHGSEHRLEMDSAVCYVSKSTFL